MEYIPAPSDIIHTIVTAPAESPSCYAIQWNDRARLEDCIYTGRRTRLITASTAATALTRHEIFPDWDETILALDDLASCMRAVSSFMPLTQGDFNLAIEIWLGAGQGSEITSLAANVSYEIRRAA
ncbi:hypothetical protein V8C40DRAFT_268634 [Trichoderma camerunense]